jgi:SAM-dependent methyltransferase
VNGPDEDRGEALDALLQAALAPLGRALEAFHSGDTEAALVVHMDDFPSEVLPVSYFFRAPAEMGAVDRTALTLARGAVLDVGACAGAHAVPLTLAGHAVTALDVIPEAVRILEARGVADARLASVWSFEPKESYDTVLALMNGTSLAGTEGALAPLLARLLELTAPEGRLLIDSTELNGEGEIHYQLEFAGEKGPPFPQLFVGEEALSRAAAVAGWSVQIVAREGARYLARLTAIPALSRASDG